MIVKCTRRATFFIKRLLTKFKDDGYSLADLVRKETRGFTHYLILCLCVLEIIYVLFSRFPESEYNGGPLLIEASSAR